MTSIPRKYSRKTPSDYQELATKRNLIWLGPAVARTKHMTTWQCDKGHIFKCTYDRLSRSKHHCPKCARFIGWKDRKTQPDDYRDLAITRGFIWLGLEVGSVDIKTSWQCSLGHKWEATYSNVQSGSGCPHCANNIPKTPIEYHQLANQRNIQWLGPLVSNVRIKTNWQCNDGHQWQAPYDVIRSGSGCPICANKNRHDWKRITPVQYHQLAATRGYKWIGDFPEKVIELTFWQCSKGHKWKSTYHNIKNGNGCPTCSVRGRKTSKFYVELSEERNLYWFGPLPTTVMAKTNWQCLVCGHKWSATAQCIRNSVRGCPHCDDRENGAKVSAIQRTLATMVNGEINRKVGSYYLDVALEIQGILIGIEYDGYYWHVVRGKSKPHRIPKMIADGWRILRIQSNYALPTLDEINTAIQRLVDGETYLEIILDD